MFLLAYALALGKTASAVKHPSASPWCSGYAPTAIKDYSSTPLLASVAVPPIAIALPPSCLRGQLPLYCYCYIAIVITHISICVPYREPPFHLASKPAPQKRTRHSFMYCHISIVCYGIIIRCGIRMMVLNYSSFALHHTQAITLIWVHHGKFYLLFISV